MKNEQSEDRDEKTMLKIGNSLRFLCGFARGFFETPKNRRRRRNLCSERGATLVEMAIASSVLFAILFGIVELGMGLYCYTFVSEAARDATRYAAVRGQNSCLTANVTPYTNCNLGPTAVGNPQASYTTSPLQTYVQGLGLPFAGGMQVATSWWSPTGATPQQWTQACTTLLDTGTGPLGGSNTQCNYPGHAIRVTVSYNYPLAIPFISARSITVQSSSQMVISE